MILNHVLAIDLSQKPLAPNLSKIMKKLCRISYFQIIIAAKEVCTIQPTSFCKSVNKEYMLIRILLEAPKETW